MKSRKIPSGQVDHKRDCFLENQDLFTMYDWVWVLNCFWVTWLNGIKTQIMIFSLT